MLDSVASAAEKQCHRMPQSCIGTKCMAWRWAEPEFRTSFEAQSPGVGWRQLEKGMGWRQDVTNRRGFCGDVAIMPKEAEPPARLPMGPAGG
jgi:hypothetical protein